MLGMLHPCYLNNVAAQRRPVDIDRHVKMKEGNLPILPSMDKELYAMQRAGEITLPRDECPNWLSSTMWSVLESYTYM